MVLLCSKKTVTSMVIAYYDIFTTYIQPKEFRVIFAGNTSSALK